MAIAPVRRAFLTLFIAAGVVALLLLLAQDQVTLKTRSAVGAAEPRHANYLSSLLGVDLLHVPEHAIVLKSKRTTPERLHFIMSVSSESAT